MNAPATAQQQNTILFPVGRLVQGDLYKGQDKDQQGRPLMTKDNKPTTKYFFAIAIPKTQAQWWYEPWGQQILAIANAAWPQGQTQNPNFAWKIEDGDSQIPNLNGRKNADREGHAGHWIVKFSSTFAPKIFDSQGNAMLQPDLVKAGYWIEVLGTVQGNGEMQKPGIYINHNMVAYRAPGKEIVSGPDPRAVGFGRSSLPPGVTAAPVGTAAFPAAPGAAPGPVPSGVTTPAVPAGGYTPAPAGMPAPGMSSAGVPGGYPAPNMATPPAMVPTAVAPHPGILAPPMANAPAPAAPMAPSAMQTPATPAPAAYIDPLGAPAGYRMVNPAGARYEAYRMNGWTDATLISSGHMVRL